LPKLLRLKEANEAASKVCKGCVDFGKTSEETLAAALAIVAEYLAGLSPEMLGRVTSLQEGILLKSKFMPTVADYHALVQELEAKDRQFKPAHTSYRKLTKAREEPHDEASKKRIAGVVKSFKDSVMSDDQLGRLN
jgi:hypothetical protein